MLMKSENQLSLTYSDKEDLQLIEESLNGSSKSLDILIKRHRMYIYNIAQKMVLSPFDAEDITQEVLIKVVTKLPQFKYESNFRTWLYRITFNHILKMKKYWLEHQITSFSDYGSQLDDIKSVDLSAEEDQDLKDLVEEAKLACINGMLLCLDRDQRLVYILGEIFSVDHNLGAQLLEITQDNFRQKLSRARKDLYQFMHQKCGLINKNNPCRCSKKTKGFIEAGWVDPNQMKFNISYFKKIKDIAPEKSKDLDDFLDSLYANIFRDTPFQEKEVENIINKDKLKNIFRL